MGARLAAALLVAIPLSALAQDEPAAPPEPEPEPAEAQPAETGEAEALPLALTGETAGKYQGFYLRAGVGFVGVADTDFRNEFGYREVEFDPGFGAAAAFGYDFGSVFRPGASADRFTLNLRMEVETSVEAADADDDGGFGPAARLEELRSFGLGINTYLDFDIRGPWTFYAGLGLGVAQVETEGTGFDDEDTVGFVQLLGGAIFEVSDRASLYSGLRARGYDDVDAGMGELVELATGAIEVGLIFQF